MYRTLQAEVSYMSHRASTKWIERLFDRLVAPFENVPPSRFALLIGLAFMFMALGFNAIAQQLDPDDRLEEIVRHGRHIVLSLFVGLSAFVAGLVIGRHKSHLEKRRREFTIDFIHRLATLSSWRDDETGDHAERVGKYCSAIARGLGWNAEDAAAIGHAGILHDIGKIAVPDRLLMKRDGYTPEDRALIQSHTLLGSEIFAGSHDPIFKMAQEISMAHHEWWDGTGYPYGLKGGDIPVSARIAAVADVFDALTTKRRYKEAFGFDESVEIVRSLQGTQFDPQVVDAFVSSLREIQRTYLRHLGAATRIAINRAS